MSELKELVKAINQSYEQGKKEERARWLPLWDAIKKFDSYFDFNTPIGKDNNFEDTQGINQAMKVISKVMSDLKYSGEK